MPEWRIEQGIGETRAILEESGEILAARVFLEGALRAGSVIEARLASVGSGGRNAIVRTAEGAEILLPRRPAGVTEGAAIKVEITREAIPGSEDWKRPIGRATDLPIGEAAIEGSSRTGDFDWPAIVEEARSGIVHFGGGSLRIVATPAMTLIDVDGTLAPDALAIDGARSAALAIRRLGIGGSIGVDLPTAGRTARQQAAQAIDDALPQPFERTAVNGFGFVQIVRPRRHASLIELAADRAAFEARALLRSAGQSVGAIRLVAHPAVVAALTPDWLERLGRQVGGAVGLRADPTIAMSGGYAEPV